MGKVTNHSQGDKAFQVRSGDSLAYFMIPAGSTEEFDGELVETEVTKAWAKSGAVSFGTAKPREQDPNKVEIGPGKIGEGQPETDTGPAPRTDATVGTGPATTPAAPRPAPIDPRRRGT